jgi:DNA-binding response OmpR family regulator
MIIEDDTALRLAITVALEAVGYTSTALADGRGVDAVATAFRPDLAIVDVRLPVGPDGFCLGQTLRIAGVPVVFVTAADALEERLRGFEIGADDYLVKPFAMAELLARVNAVLRRSGRASSASFEVRDLLIDDVNRVAIRGGEQLELTKTEFDLLSTLAREPGRVFSKIQLLSLVWGFEDYAPNVVEVHMSALRRKLEMHGPRLILTERGEGYVLRP